MKSRIAKMTVVAIVLLTGAPQIHAEEAAALPGGSPFAKAPGFASEASYSGYIGDDSELQEPPEIVDTAPPTAADWGPADAKYRSAHDLGKKGGKAGSGKAGHSGGAGVYSPWVSFEYMSTWLEGRYLPPLVSTSPPGTEGVVPGATVLFGGEDVSGNRQAAGKLSVGGWFDESERLGAGGKFFEVQTETIGFSAASNANGSPLLARPFYETWPSASGGVGPASFLVAGQTTVGTLPFTLTGDIQAVTQTDVMGAEGYLRYLLYCAPGRRLDLIGGYQFSRVDDRLQINNSTDVQPPIFGAHFEAEDLFDTQNKFHGGELGLLGEFGRGPVTLSVLAKVGLGNMNEVVNIAGPNIGTYKQDKFAFIPEVEIKLNFKLTRHLEATVGYDFIYWSTLALAGEQIDTSAGGLPTVNSSQWLGGALDPAGGTSPAFSGIKDSSLWLQGLSVGLTLRM
ncbi:MAG: BBP7 family outer membrane beta-barrel protein [Pirellulaceae bacterium]|nr:BBP7 family outer membrane beta-barrel protein [Pirellulaceae bacterium]